MIRSEGPRRNIQNAYEVPADVRRALNEWNKRNSIKLDLLFDEESGKWQFYRIKSMGLTPGDDVLCWQMSVPSAGTGITPGAIDWLRQYDTSNNGMKDQDEIRKDWLKTWLEADKKKEENKRNILDEQQKVWQDYLRGAVQGGRVQVHVPITVGWNKKKNKPIRMVPKGK